MPKALKPKLEKAQLPFRAIKYDLLWDTYRHSPALDVHYETCRDLNYWEKFLDMMVFTMPCLWYIFLNKKNMSKEAKDKLRFHWSILRKEVASDVDIAINAVMEK